MVWKPSEPVEWLEAEYADWTLIATGTYDGMTMLRVQDGDGWTMSGSYTQPMVQVKNDLIETIMDLPCGECLARSHRCTQCKCKLKHMAGGYCPRCWLMGASWNAPVAPWAPEEEE